MKQKYALLAALWTSLAFTSCQSPSPTTTPAPAVHGKDPQGPQSKVALINSFNHSPEEFQNLQHAALAGDPEAALRIAEHYALARSDDAEAKKWYRLAVKNGGEKEAAIYKSFLRTR